MKTIKRQIIPILLFFLPLFTSFAQDTLYYEAKNERITTKELADFYKVYVPDTTQHVNILELTYFKSGKLKSSQPMLFRLKKNTPKVLKRDFEAGKIPLNNNSLEIYLDKTSEGKGKEWYESGKLHKEMEYLKGKLYGAYVSYWENGQIKRKEQFDDKNKSTGVCFNQEGKEIAYIPFEQKAEFPGGNKALYSFINSRIRYPRSMLEYGVSGRVIVQFYINKEGEIFDVSVVQKLHPDGDQEVIRLVSSLPKWRPFLIDGEIAVGRITLPVAFSLSTSMPIMPKTGN